MPAPRCLNFDQGKNLSWTHAALFGFCFLLLSCDADAYQSLSDLDRSDSEILRVIEKAEEVLKNDSPSRFRVDDEQLIRDAVRTRDTLARTELLHSIVDGSLRYGLAR